MAKRVQQYSLTAADGTVTYGQWDLPMTDERLEEIRATIEQEGEDADPTFREILDDLLAEVDRLRAPGPSECWPDRGSAAEVIRCSGERFADETRRRDHLPNPMIRFTDQ